MAYTYTELSAEEQRAAYRARIRDLESQHLQIQVRVDAPGLGEGTDSTAATNLTELETSLQKLHDELSAVVDPPAQPAAPESPAPEPTATQAS